MSSKRELLQAMKAGSQASITIPVGDPVMGVLRPLTTTNGKVNGHDVRVLTQWRNRYVRSFLTEFEATETRTEQWLLGKVGPDSTRILFMLDDVQGNTIGHLGLAFIDWDKRTGEADAIVRGVAGTPGLVKNALLTLLGWAHRKLGLLDLSVRVRSDNPAVTFYLKFGTETRRVPLRVIQEPAMTRWVEDESVSSSSVQLVYITFDHDLYD